MITSSCDIVIVGAGMAGASLAAELAPHARVMVLEAEDLPGAHATGRSAAFWVESYGGPHILPLTRASGRYLANHGFLRDRGGLHIARADQLPLLERFERCFSQIGVALQRLDRAAMEALVPGLLPAWREAVLEPDARDIDVAGLHQHYLALARKAGAGLRCRTGLVQAERQSTRWRLALSDGQVLGCDILVNAAGAWADGVACMAGARPLGITPYRRTMVQLAMGLALKPDLPLVLDIGGSFYFKPQGASLWLTPHDEHPSMPCDAAADMEDVALAIDRLTHTVDWPVDRVEHRWAGLRSFAPDRLPVYGPDVRVPGFFWFAGQGGFGIQTAPAAARLAARHLLDMAAGDEVTGLSLQPYLPVRFG